MKAEYFLTLVLSLFLLLIILLNCEMQKIQKTQINTLKNISTLQDQFIENLKDQIEFKKSLNRASRNRNTKENIRGN